MGSGTKGIELAAEYIARQFAAAGLKTNLFDGKPFQKFSIGSSSELGKNNKLTFVGPPPKEGAQPQTIELVVEKDYNPLALGGSKSFDLPLVFVGYGITAKAEKYDDYQGLDVAGKAVIVLRHEPQQEDPKSVFNGTRDSPYAAILRKVANAQEHKAAAIIFCTDELEIRKHLAESRRKWHEAIDRLTDEHERQKKAPEPTLAEIEAQQKRIDDLMRRRRAVEQADPRAVRPGAAAGARRRRLRRDFPVLHCRRVVLDRVVRPALGTDLATLERQIDEGPTPAQQGARRLARRRPRPISAASKRNCTTSSPCWRAKAPRRRRRSWSGRITTIWVMGRLAP